MKPMYQGEWLGIQFSDFANLSETQLAGPEFYNAFYRELFRRYGDYEELDATWRRNKRELADWIAGNLRPGARVLSIGCGLGYMERCLHRDHGNEIELYVSDYASDALKWLSQELPKERILQDAKGGVASEHYYDLIYFSSFDYAVPTEGMVEILKEQLPLLVPSGTCLMISASYFEEDLPVAEKMRILGKEVIKHSLRYFGLFRRDRGQFWGWKRTRSEYRDLMQSAGYFSIKDGFIETPNQRTYFIRGSS